jgi:phosphatidylinositol glycan class N
LINVLGDGLRADKAFQSFPEPYPAEDVPESEWSKPRPMAPFIRSKVLNDGTFGVSHTRVPTESRPGHVALIAGLYEDVSAVMTGWKLNPVNFDSVFNRSRHTWSWGSPDILPMFKEGAVPGRVDTDCYGEEAEDFTSDATKLDIWVFDGVKELFASAKTNATLNAELRKDKNVFFLHLLGLDTTGHGYRPYSKEYLHNIQVVDEGVAEITKLVDEFYGDGKTAYVFTADHGMSDWGSHGDGHPDNTRTPLVVWGSGVASPATVEKGNIATGHEDGFSSDWGFDHIVRNDVEQADIATLMAYLVGLEYPVNSVGKLPLSYLARGRDEQAEAMFTNVKEILEMYRVKADRQRSLKLRFVPFADLGNDEDIDIKIFRIQQLIDAGNYEEAIASLDTLLDLTLQGLRYLQTYDWLFLRTVVSLGYLGWMAFAFTSVLNLHVLPTPTPSRRTIFSSVLFGGILAGSFSLLFLEKASWTYYPYVFFPVMFWEDVFAKRNALFTGLRALVGEKPSYFKLLLEVIVYVAALEALVLSYFRREVFTVFFVLTATWPMFYGHAFLQKNVHLAIIWAIASLSMGSFTLLPVVKIENINLITIGGVQMLLLGIFYLLWNNVWRNQTPTSSYSKTIFGLQIGLTALAIAVTRSSLGSLQAKQGLPLGNLVVGWATFIFSLLAPFLHSFDANPDYLHRLVILFLTFAPTFIILTISYEGLFYFTFSILMLLWTQMEVAIFSHYNPQSQSSHTAAPAASSKQPLQSTRLRRLSLSDTRLALFFLTLLQTAFFATGNIASVSSFSLDSVYRLIPIFDPFSQAALLILKIIIPFFIVSVNLAILNKKIFAPEMGIFMVVLIIADVMTLNFFWMVKDEGSWLEIGSTISHFVIASALGVFVAALESLSALFLRGVEITETREEGRNDGPVEIHPKNE